MKIEESFRLAIVIIFFIIFFGCTSAIQSWPGAPGYISESISNFDKTSQISMQPAMLKKGDILLGLYKTSKMPEDMLILIAVCRGVESFSQGESLHFNIDGKIVSFASIDKLTEFERIHGVASGRTYVPGHNESSKRYVVTKGFIRKLIDAKEVWVKIDLSKAFVEDEFSYDFPTCARPGFREVYKRIMEW